MKKRNRKVLVQIGALILALFALAALLNSQFIYLTSKANYIDTVEEHTGQVLLETRTRMEAYAALPWLLDYWQTHTDTMELPGDRAQRAEAVSRLLLERKIDSPRSVTTAQAEAFSEKEQRLFAEYCYLEIMPLYYDLKSNFNLASLHCVTLVTMEEAVPFFQALPEGELTVYGNFCALGENWPFNAEKHPAIIEMYEKQENVAFYETVRSTVEDAVYLFGYLPIIRDGSIRCYICAANVMSTLREGLRQDIQSIEIINLVVMIAAAVLLLFLIYWLILRNLKFVHKTVDRYRKTKDSGAVVKDLKSVKTNNEVGKLADAFSGMALEMDQYTEELVRVSAEKERMDTELSLANKIQADVLPNVFPPFPDRKEFDIYAAMAPAKEIGGDFYDFFFIDDTHLGLVIADVSGKGVPAALFMMISKIVIQQYAKQGLSPKDALEAANRTICANNREEMFITVWLGVLDLETGMLTAANAGHDFPMMKRSGRPFTLIEGEHGFVLGGFEGSRYKEDQILLRPGDTVFLYTDGVPEAGQTRSEMFGTKRMLKALNSCPDTGPEELLKKLRAEVDAFVGDSPQFDDLTMLCVRYNGPGQKC